MKMPRSLIKLFSSYWFYALLGLLVMGVISRYQTITAYSIIRKETVVTTDQPTVIMYKVQVDDFDSQGRLESSLAAGSLAQFTNGNTSASEPVLTVYKDGNKEPVASVAASRMDSKDEYIGLLDNVVVEVYGANPVRMLADEANYTPDAGILEASAPTITNTDENTTVQMQADRMLVDIEKETTTLEGKVRTSVTITE